MKKINAWLKKFFRIGKGEDVYRAVVAGGKVYSWPNYQLKEYTAFFDPKALKDGTSIIIDHNKKTVKFKMI